MVSSSAMSGAVTGPATDWDRPVRRILVVERDLAESERIVGDLNRQGYHASGVHTGRHLLDTYASADLVLLSLDLPDMDGLEVCRRLRAVSDVPLIARSRYEDELERVLALREGADDCMTRSWGFHEVRARIDAVLRRCAVTAREAVPELIAMDPLVLHVRTREVHVRGEPVDITSKEFDLLYALAAKPDVVRSRKELMAEVWGSAWGCSARTIDTHVASLRAKLGCPRCIITVRGVGYRIGQVRQAPAESTG